ncbi:MAG: tryptophan-rich sensory protein [Telmatospirillum sp.]|nr:tryptophan-rich sensory protein [Telmatospirillum sp.]
MRKSAAPAAGATIVAAGGAVAVAMAGGLLTDTGTWYQSLRTPAWKPPDAAFPAIWMAVFLLTAIAGVLAWRRPAGPSRRLWSHRQSVLILFLFNGLLNILWSLMFFQIRRPDLALVEGMGLWLSILALIVVIRRRSPWAGVLLLPYLAWVSLACRLNYDVVLLNGPFG